MLSTGLEPMTLALSEPRATNCAKRACCCDDTHWSLPVYLVCFARRGHWLPTAAVALVEDQLDMATLLRTIVCALVASQVPHLSNEHAKRRAQRRRHCIATRKFVGASRILRRSLTTTTRATG